MSEHLLQHGTRGPTPQREMAPLTDQVPNAAGGFVWAIDKWARLRRFLILGTEGGSYYASERKLTAANVASLRECIAEDGPRTVAEIVAVSHDGRAPKNDTALYALAACIALGDDTTKREAGLALPRVARIGTHLYDFVAYAESMRGWGRVLRKAVQSWYDDKPLDQLAYDAIKYRQRNGWSHRDLLRLSHPTGGHPEPTVEGEGDWTATTRGALYNFIAHEVWEPEMFPILDGFVKAQESQSPAETARLVRQYRLPREALLTPHLNDPEVWRAMLDGGMPIGALTRNLATMTRNGILEGDYRSLVVAALKDQESIRKSRLHPYALLLALATYRQGYGYRSSNTWQPIGAITDALDEAFYLAFGNVEPTGKKILIAVDVSGSMGALLGDSSLTVLQGAGAMAMVTGAVETNADCVTFSSGGSAWLKTTGTHWGRQYGYAGRDLVDGLEPFSLSKRRRLDDVVAELQARNMGGTDCALPMTYATETERDYDAFVIYTDNETWAGDIHPFEALRKYRAASGNHDARLVVVGMTASKFSIADPNDRGMLDVVGFDTATPNLIAEFVAGRL